jgi:hypothetical protein
MVVVVVAVVGSHSSSLVLMISVFIIGVVLLVRLRCGL